MTSSIVPHAGGPRGVRFTMLGPVTATVDGEPVGLGGPKQRAVVAVLMLAHGHPVSSDRLIDALWPETPPSSAPAALQAYVSHLRRALQPGAAARSRRGVIVSAGNTYALHTSDDAVDAWRFERLVEHATRLDDPTGAVHELTEALELWAGDPLAGHAHEPWAEAEVRRLTELHAIARERLLAARLECGESALLVPELEALLDEDRLREARWRLLALALYRADRQGDALAQLRRARAVLADELGIDPGPGLRDLETQILAQADSLAAPPQPAATTRPAPAAASQHDLVDREHELATIRACLNGALDGEASVAFIEGAAGIGKNRLLAQVRREAAAAGATVVAARGSQIEKEYGFGVVRQLFEPLLADPAVREAWLSGAAGAAATVFDASGDSPRPEGLFSVLHGLYWLTVNASANGPLVIAVDDLQWCDSGSLRFLAYLARRLEGTPVLVAATLRTGEHHDDALWDDLASDPATVPIQPGPLTLAGVGDLVRSQLGASADDAFVRACHATTLGNPLLVRQLLRALEADHVTPITAHADTVRAIGSRAVSSMVLRRFGRMPPTHRTVARAVAVLGDGASLPTVAALSGLPEDETATSIAALARAELLRDDSPVGFVHPLVEAAVYDDLLPGERELQHERAAQVLTGLAAPTEKIAAHLLLVPARADESVVRTLREAARREIDRGAGESAVAYLRRALVEPPSGPIRYEVMLELGRIETRLDGPSAVDHLTGAFGGLADPQLRADAAIDLARTLVFAGTRGGAAEVARTAIDSLPDTLADEIQHLLAVERIAGYMHDLDPMTYRSSLPPAIEADAVGARALAATLAWEHLIEGTDRVGAIELAKFAVADGSLQRADAGLLWVVAGNVMQLAGLDTNPFWTEALADAHARGGLFMALGVHLWQGYAQWQCGDLREATQSLRNCTEQNELWGAAHVGQAYVDAFMIRILIDRGDVPGARRALDAARQRAPFGDGVRLCLESEVMLLLAEQRPDEAFELDAGLDDLMTVVQNPVWRPWRSQRAHVLAALGRLDEARALIDDELAPAQAWGTAELVGRTLRMRGELSPGGDGVDDLRSAVALLEKTPARLEHARALAGLGTALTVGTGASDADRAEAVAVYGQALDLSRTCAADGLAARIGAALERNGVAVPEPRAPAVLLTTTERRIAAMTLDGALDREIAQALFMTPSTVQRTITSVCDQLGVTSVGDLRAVLPTT